jgi:hypothetical protein
MYNNIGKKIMVLSQIIGWLWFVAGTVVGIILLARAEQIGLVVLVSGVVALLSSWFLYGFGQLVSDIHEMKGNQPASAPTPAPVSIPATEKKIHEMKGNQPASAPTPAPVSIPATEKKEESMATHNCPKCGAKNAVSRVFCKECGERLS